MLIIYLDGIGMAGTTGKTLEVNVPDICSAYFKMTKQEAPKIWVIDYHGLRYEIEKPKSWFLGIGERHGSR